MAKGETNSNMGRPPKLTQELVDKARNYLDENDRMGAVALLPTVERLSLLLDVHRDTLYEWAKTNQDFSDILRRLKASQGDKLIQNALANKYNSTIAKLLLSSKHDYVEKSSVDQNINGDVSFLNAVPRPTRDGDTDQGS